MLASALLTAALGIAVQLTAAPAPHAVREGRFHSAALAREVPYQVLLPAGYDASCDLFRDQVLQSDDE